MSLKYNKMQWGRGERQIKGYLLVQRLKRLPAMWETWVRSLGREDSLVTHSSILAWRIPWTEELGGLQSTGGKESDTTERLHFHICIHDYWKNNSFDGWNFVGKVMSLLFNMLSRFVIAFLPRSKHLLISWLKPPSAVILEPKKIKSVTVSIVSLSICHEVMGPDAINIT